MLQKRCRDYGLTVGELPTGPLNKISDVPGVLVGHATLDDARHKTGVTVVIPGAGDPVFPQARGRRLCAQRLWQDAGADAGAGTGRH